MTPYPSNGGSGSEFRSAEVKAMNAAVASASAKSGCEWARLEEPEEGASHSLGVKGIAKAAPTRKVATGPARDTAEAHHLDLNRCCKPI